LLIAFPNADDPSSGNHESLESKIPKRKKARPNTRLSDAPAPPIFSTITDPNSGLILEAFDSSHQPRSNPAFRPREVRFPLDCVAKVESCRAQDSSRKH